MQTITDLHPDKTQKFGRIFNETNLKNKIILSINIKQFKNLIKSLDLIKLLVYYGTITGKWYMVQLTESYYHLLEFEIEKEAIFQI